MDNSRKNRISLIAVAVIVVINAVLVICSWKGLPDPLPCHFDPQGNAGGTMPKSSLGFFPVISAIVCLALLLGASAFKKLREPESTGRKCVICLCQAIALIILCSTCVTLTMGQQPVFMYLEPVILILAIIAIVCFVIKGRKK